MTIKEAIAEIEKRYKVGDKITCLAYPNDAIIYRDVDVFTYISIQDGDSLWVAVGDTRICMISKNGTWSEPIREGKNLWFFFMSIEGTYPDVVEKYLRNFDFKFSRKENTVNAIDVFDWNKSKEGFDYWADINKLYTNYLEN